MDAMATLTLSYVKRSTKKRPSKMTHVLLQESKHIAGGHKQMLRLSQCNVHCCGISQQAPHARSQSADSVHAHLLARPNSHCSHL
eukprot:5135138-Pleurochrysis_carterae.AAC.1